MPDRKTIRMTGEGPQAQRIGGITWTPGRVEEVDAEEADSLVDRYDYFEEGEPDDDDGDEEPLQEQEPEDGAVVTEDVTPPADFDEAAWMDQDHEVRADRVEEGEVDNHLDRLEAVERSQTVQDSIEERREELEG